MGKLKNVSLIFLITMTAILAFAACGSSDDKKDDKNQAALVYEFRRYYDHDIKSYITDETGYMVYAAPDKKDNITGTLEIKDTYNGKPVKYIGSDNIAGKSFSECKNLTSLKLPSTIELIVDGVFNGCTALASVNFAVSETPIEIRPMAFMNCSALKVISLPANIAKLSTSAFKGCDELFATWYYNSDTVIEYDLHNSESHSCNQIKKVIVPDGVTVIKPNIKQTAVTEVEISATVKIIEDNSFKGHSSYFGNELERVTFANGSQLESIGEGAFKDCLKLLEISLPSSLKSIGSFAFYNCKSLKNLELPASVESIGTSAFSEGDHGESEILKNISIKWNYNPALTAKEFAYNLTEVVIADSIDCISAEAFKDCVNLLSVIFPETITEIGDDAFNNCEELTILKIPAAVESIGNRAFKDCSHLKSINLSYNDSSLKIIGEEAFRGCSNLKSGHIPDGVTSVGARAFYESGIEWAYIPASLERIENETFRNCLNLYSVTIEEGVKVIGQSAFFGCSKLLAIRLPNGVADIEYSAFANCNLRMLYIPKTVQTIREYIFWGGVMSGSRYTTIYIEAVSKPNGWHNNWNGNFDYSNYGKLYWGVNNTNFYDDEMFQFIISGDSAALTSFSTNASAMNIPSEIPKPGSVGYLRVSEIGEYAFAEADFTSFSLTTNITTIKQDAFFRCNLPKIYIPLSVTTIEARAFEYCDQTKFYVQATKKPDGWSNDWNRFSSELYRVYYGVNLSSLSPTYYESSFVMYKLSGNTAAVVGYHGSESSLKIPQSFTINSVTYTVTSIEPQAIQGLKTLELPQSITSIISSSGSASNAFSADKVIFTSSTPPDSLNNNGQPPNSLGTASIYIVPNAALQSYKEKFPSIANKIFPDTQKDNNVFFNIQEGVLISCTVLGGYEIKIPETVTKIGDRAINGASIRRVIVPASVTEIGEYGIACSNAIVFFKGVPPVLTEDTYNVRLGFNAIVVEESRFIEFSENEQFATFYSKGLACRLFSNADIVDNKFIIRDATYYHPVEGEKDYKALFGFFGDDAEIITIPTGVEIIADSFRLLTSNDNDLVLIIPNTVCEIYSGASFSQFTIYFAGENKVQWNSLISPYMSFGDIYFYSSTKNNDGRHWRFVDDIPTLWE